MELEHHRATTLEYGSMCRVATESSSKDSCVITTSGHVFIVYGIHFSDKEAFLVARKFKNKSSFFEIPAESCDIGVYRVSNLTSQEYVIPRKNVVSKMFLLPYKEEFVAQTLVHSSNNAVSHEE